MPENADPAAAVRPVEVLLSLGSNIDPERHLRLALDELRSMFGEAVVSPAYRTAAVGFDGAPFVNNAAAIRTTLPLEGLEAWLHALEDRHGRDRSGPRLSDRTLDVDVVFYGDHVLREGERVRIPRPELKHAFVLRPIACLPLLAPIRLRRNERVFIAWAGLKGAVPILLGALAVTGGTPESSRIYGIVFVVVLLSVGVQGSTLSFVARKMGIEMRSAQAD